MEAATEDILFIDIETITAERTFGELSETMKELWEKRSRSLRKEDETAADLYEKASLYAEFGRIISISAGFQTGDIFRVKSVYGEDESELLTGFAEIVNKWTSRRDPWICGHNVKDFDIPYIARRMIINRIMVPQLINNAGKKPWEVKSLDTMELWKFGDYRSSASLALLAEILGIPTPKDDIDGSMVGKVYWEENDIKRIVRYCEKDVVTVARVFSRITGRLPIADGTVESLTSL